MSEERVGAVVVGAGVIGLAVARALAQAGHDTVVLEQARAIGTGVSSRSSEVIHAGLYDAPGSRKARCWCVRGRQLLYDFVERHDVAYRRCGKLVVACTADEEAALHALSERAAAHGVPLQWLDGPQVRARAPALRACAALWSPETGIVDSHGLMQALLGQLQTAGGLLALGSVFEGAEPVGAQAQGGGACGGARSTQRVSCCTPPTWSTRPDCGPATWHARCKGRLRRAGHGRVLPRAVTSHWPDGLRWTVWSTQRPMMPGWGCI